MFDIGGGELLLILIVVLIAFGPRKLPELAQSLGRGIREFKRAQRDFTDQINSAFEQEQRRQTRTVSRTPTSVTPPQTPDQSTGTEHSILPPMMQAAQQTSTELPATYHTDGGPHVEHAGPTTGPALPAEATLPDDVKIADVPTAAPSGSEQLGIFRDGTSQPSA